MDHAPTAALKLCAILAVLLPLHAQAPDPADILVRAREKILAVALQPPNISCTQVVDRSYFSRLNPPDRKLSCDQISADRGRGRAKMQLDATDRIRLKVFMLNGREVFAWAEPLKFESHDLEDVLEAGPIGTGAFGVYFTGLFGNPEARFQFLSEKQGKLEYGFQEPSEASRHIVRAGEHWISTAHAGSFLIDAVSLDPERFTVETSTLAPETSMCESASTVDYHRIRIGAEDALLPRRAESHNVMVTTHETSSIAAYSSCAAGHPALDPPVNAASILPENIQIPLALDNPIDTETAAAGDLISASVSKDVVMARDGRVVLLHRGTHVHGRILSMEHQFAKPERKVGSHFAIAISFDVIEIDGIASPLHVRLNRDGTLQAGGAVLTADSSHWPEDALVFPTPQNRFLVPRGYESKWVTTK